MLETINDFIQSLPNISFDQFYNDYIASVQDSNIDDEIAYIIKHNALNLSMMDRLIQHTHERLMQICSVTQKSSQHM